MSDMSGWMSGCWMKWKTGNLAQQLVLGWSGGGGVRVFQFGQNCCFATRNHNRQTKNALMQTSSLETIKASDGGRCTCQTTMKRQSYDPIWVTTRRCTRMCRIVGRLERNGWRSVQIVPQIPICIGNVAEWLTRLTRNQLPSGAHVRIMSLSFLLPGGTKVACSFF